MYASDHENFRLGYTKPDHRFPSRDAIAVWLRVPFNRDFAVGYDFAPYLRGVVARHVAAEYGIHLGSPGSQP